MAHLQWMEVNFSGYLDYLTDKICQMNSQVGRIARRQTRIGSFSPSPSLSLEASADEADDSSSDDDKMTTSQ